MSVIEEVKQKTDIAEVISQYVALKKAGRNLRALCPFHSEKQPSFFVYPEQQSWHCFGACNTGGDVFSFIMKKEGLSFGDVLRLLAERAGVALPSRQERDARQDERERLYQINQQAAWYFHNLLLNSPAAEKARGYIARRGLCEKTVTDFQLGYSPDSWEALKKYMTEKEYTAADLLAAGLIVEAETGKTHDRFRGKLMFPITDERGHTTGFGARALDDSQPKYINSPQTLVFDKSASLYGINLARTAIRQQDLVVIVEGYMDVITAHQNGYSNVVASMGTAIAERHLGILKKLTKNVVLALDADRAGEEAMLRCVDYENYLDAEVRVITLPEGKDPDDVIRQDTALWEQLVSKAIPVIDFTFNMVTAPLDLATARDKSRAADRLLPIVAELKDDIRRDHYVNKLASLTKTSYRSIEAALSRIKPSRRKASPVPEATARVTRHTLASPVEEYCLVLLLQHPELKAHCPALPPEYFENSENRELFTAWQESTDLPALKEKLDAAIWEHLDYLLAKSLPATRLEQKLADCSLRLREKFLRNLETKRKEILALEAEAGGTTAELAKLQEQGIDVSVQLGEVFTQRVKRPASKGARDGKR